MTATRSTMTAMGNKTTGGTMTARGGTAATGSTMTARAAGQQGEGRYNDNNGRHNDAAR